MRSVGKGTIEARGKGRWRLRVSVRHDDGTTERLDRTVETRTKTEARGMLDDWREELRHCDVPVSRKEEEKGDMTLREYLEGYLAYCHDVKRLSPNTVRGYRDIVRNRWTPRIGSTPLRRLSPEMLDEHVSWLRTCGGARNGCLLNAM